MARTRTSTVLPLLLVLGAIAVFSPQVIDKVDELFGGSDPVLVGSGDMAFMVGSDGGSKAKKCSPEEVVRDRGCDGVKVVVINAAKMPFIARNIKLAWQDGKPAILTRNSANRAAACGKFMAKYTDGSCDEFAFATTDQGGADARTDQISDKVYTGVDIAEDPSCDS